MPESMRRGGPRFTGVIRVWLLNAALVAVAAALYAGPLRNARAYDGTVRIPWFVLAGVFYLAERFVIHVHFRRNAESFSLSEIPVVIALFFVSPIYLVTAQLAGAGSALIFNRKQSVTKLVFNLAQFATGTAIATLVFRAIASSGGLLHGTEAAGAGFGVLAMALLGVGTVVMAISLSEGHIDIRMIPKVLILGLIVALTNSSVALVAVVLLRTAGWTAWLLSIPAATLFIAYRAYQQQRSQNESLEFLYESTRMLQGTLELEGTLRGLLEQVRKMFRAEIARVTLFDVEGDQNARRTVLGPDTEWTFMKPVDLDPKKGVWARVASEEQAIVIAKPIRNERLRRYFESEGGIRDAMVAPLLGDGRVIGTLLVANRLGDVTTFDQEDLKLFETFANHASISLENARLVSELRASLTKMTEMNHVKDEFVATVSHELRTPLTCIIGFLKTLLREDVEYSREETRDMLTVAERQSENLHGLIEDLLLVSRIESRPIKTVPSTFVVGNLLHDVVGAFTEEGTQHHIELIGGGSTLEMRSDPSALRRILSNLIENAVKYSPIGTTIRLSVRPDGLGMRFAVEDEGPGVPPEARERIFDRFYQVDQSNTRTSTGVGLGLYICKSLSESLGGRLTCGEAPQGGAAFVLWVPQDARADEQVRLPRLRAI
jgi:K+-sensing histidine kinase KdpD